MADIEKLAVIIGSAKAGTTAVANHLGTHPDAVLGRIKEPRFFTEFGKQNWVGPATEGFKASLLSTWDDYRANFDGLDKGQWAIDASTDYIWSPDTPDLLSQAAERVDIRVICIVRDPVDRAVSEYNHTLRRGWETLSFADSLDAEPSRREKGWHPLFYHKRRSTILDDLEKFAGRFGPQLLVIDYADLKDAKTVTDRICAFLGIPEMQPRDMERKNESFLPRNRIASAVLKSSALKAAARAVVPRSLRTHVWSRLHTNARNLVTVNDSERARFRALISDEIDRCVNSPLIPTDRWSCVKRD